MRRVTFVTLLLLGAFLTNISLSSNTNSTDIIYWNQDYNLSWSDFRGKPRFDHKSISAITSSGIMHYRGCENGKIIYKIIAYFEKDESWVKQEAYNNYILAHEQLHFNVTELFARKLRKSLAERSFKCGEEAEFEAFVDNFINAWQQKQNAYDALTRHSLDKKQQQEWAFKIALELSLLEDFKDNNLEE